MKHFGGIVTLFMLAAPIFGSFAEAGPSGTNHIGLKERVRVDKKGIPLSAPNAATDKVAYAIQKKAIVKLKKLIKSGRAGAQESALLIKLARMQQDTADVTFRIAHADAYAAKKPIKLKYYKSALKESIRTLDLYIKKFSKEREVAFAYQMRARAYSEIGLKESAIRDFSVLIKRFPKFELVNSAYIALAEYAEEEGKYRKAIKLLKKVLETRIDPEYPYALFKLAWDHFSLDEVDTTFQYVKKYVDYYNLRIKEESRSKRVLISAKVLRDDLLSETALFFLRGYELKLPRYQNERALSFFKRVVMGPESDPVIGKIIVRYAKLLRSRGYEDALVQWKDRVIASESKRPESVEVLLLAYEDQMNRYRFKKMLSSAQDMQDLYARHRDDFNFDPARSLLLKSAGRVQTAIEKQKNSWKGQNVVLSGIYGAFLKIMKVEDPRRFRVRYNLAQALAGAGKIEMAIANYLWVMKNGDDAPKDQLKKKDVLTAGMSAVALRYDVFKKKNLIPAGITPTSLEEDQGEKLQEDVQDWLAWMAWIEKKRSREKVFKDLDFYLYESNRTLYSQKNLRLAVDRMQDFVAKYPNSKFAVPSSQLIIDTMIKTEDWDKTHQYARWFLKLPAWKERKKLRKGFFLVAADSYYKRAEQLFAEEDFKSIVSRSAIFEKFYMRSPRKADWLNLVARASLKVEDEEGAMGFYTKLLQEAPDSDYVGSALLAKANRSERLYRFDDSAVNFQSYLKLPQSKQKISEKEKMKIRQKILLLSWLAGKPTSLAERTKDPAVCLSTMSHYCDQYFALAVIARNASGKNDVAIAKKRLRQKTPELNRTLWAFVLLNSSERLKQSSRIALVKNIVDGWGRLDSMVQYSLLENLSVSIPGVFEGLRMELSARAPVKAEETSIQRRLKEVQKIESLASHVMKIPFARVQASVLNEVAGLYIDLAKDLNILKPPTGLSDEERQIYRETIAEVAVPFEDTGKKIRGESYKIASRAGIEDSSFQIIARPYFEENPVRAKALLPEGDFFSSNSLSLETLKVVDASRAWREPKQDPTDAVPFLKSRWVLALKFRKWPEVAYYLQVAKDKKMIEEGVLGVMRAISLTAAGGRAEGLIALDKTRKQLSEENKRFVSTRLIQIYLGTLAAGRIKKYLRELDESKYDIPLTNEEATMVSHLSGIQLRK